jgi:hypothetical protein
MSKVSVDESTSELEKERKEGKKVREIWRPSWRI